MVETSKTEEEEYVFVNGAKVFMKDLVRSNQSLADMIYEGSYGDTNEVIAGHMQFDIKKSA